MLVFNFHICFLYLLFLFFPFSFSTQQKEIKCFTLGLQQILFIPLKSQQGQWNQGLNSLTAIPKTHQLNRKSSKQVYAKHTFFLLINFYFSIPAFLLLRYTIYNVAVTTETVWTKELIQSDMEAQSHKSNPREAETGESESL